MGLIKDFMNHWLRRKKGRAPIAPNALPTILPASKAGSHLLGMPELNVRKRYASVRDRNIVRANHRRNARRNLKKFGMSRKKAKQFLSANEFTRLDQGSAA